MRLYTIISTHPARFFSSASCACARNHLLNHLAAPSRSPPFLPHHKPLQSFIPICLSYSYSSAATAATAAAAAPLSHQSQSSSQSHPSSSSSSSSISSANNNNKNKRPLRSKTAVITLTDAAVQRLASMTTSSSSVPSQSSQTTQSSQSSQSAQSSQTTPTTPTTPQKYLRIGVRNKGCAGMSYHLEYVSEPSKFDEVVHQDGVTVLVDSKALFSIIGSKMDWQETPLAAKFVFTNPNIKDQCGCGESFVA